MTTVTFLENEEESFKMGPDHIIFTKLYILEDNGRGRKMAQTYRNKSLKTFGVLSIIAARVTLLF